MSIDNRFKVPVFYDERMVASDNKSRSPSAGKPMEVVKEWGQRFGDSIMLRGFDPVTPAELALAHDPAFVDAILSCKRDNGFGNRLPSVAAALPYTSGAMLSAACEAMTTGLVAVAPVSGFHHACYDSAGGFCTFNGLMVTALWLLNNDPTVRSVGILDLDNHYGNGTDNIINKLGVKDIVHFTSGKHPQIEAERFLNGLPGVIERMFNQCDVLLYQAGADQHIDDPFGGWLTTEEMKRRDALVFASCAAMALPVAWNLAGGYQEPLQKVLDLHNNTMETCIAVYERIPFH